MFNGFSLLSFILYVLHASLLAEDAKSEGVCKDHINIDICLVFISRESKFFTNPMQISEIRL